MSSKRIYRYIPQEFPMEDFMKGVQRNPFVALVYVDAFYRLFDQLDDAQQKAIEPLPGGLAIYETMMG